MPSLLHCLEENDIEAEIYTQAYLALAQWGPDIREDMLRFAETADREFLIDIAAIISRIRHGTSYPSGWPSWRSHKANKS